jgi:flagellar basal-body rod protein FlgG
MTPGKLRRTGRSLDLAIDGEGFFQLSDPDGKRTRYTRCGRFTTNAAGQIVLRTSHGDWLLEPSLTITPGTAEIEISTDGHVGVWDASSGSLLQVGVIQTAAFKSLDSLEALEGTIFAVPDAMKAAIDFAIPGLAGHGRLRPGYLEESNVDLSQEMAELERLDAEVHALRLAARLLRVPVAEPTGAPVNGSPLMPGPRFPTAGDERR